MKLELFELQAYTVYSADTERTSSCKGLYKTYGDAELASRGSGFYGSDGEVRQITVWEDTSGKLYEVKELGDFTLDGKAKKEALLNSIREKLTDEEMALLDISKE
jgi:hypothetical protein